MSKKHGKFRGLAQEALSRKEFALDKGNGLTGNGMIPHDIWRRVVPIVSEYRGRKAGDIVLLYSYLISNVNGVVDNDRYMSAFTSVDTIVEQTGLGKNRVAMLSDTLEAVGLLKTAYDYTGNKRRKLYFPQYYTILTDEEMRENMRNLLAEESDS